MKIRGLIVSILFFALTPSISAEFANYIGKSSETAVNVSTLNPVCQSMIEHLENEIVETTASLKNCENQSSDLSGKALADKTEECEQYAKKLELTKNNLTEVEEICAKGGTPDISEISKGLDKAAIEKLNKLYDANGNRMFDGVENLAAKDFNIKSNQTPTLTVNSGNVMSLKAGDPNIGIISGKSAVASLEQTASKCDSCRGIGGLPLSQACAEICCTEKPKEWCKCCPVGSQ